MGAEASFSLARAPSAGHAAPVERDPAEVDREWRDALASPDWGDRVVRVLRERFASATPLLEDARLISAEAERDEDGTPILRAVYTHPFTSGTFGVRRRLDQRPASGLPQVGETVEAWLADWIANFDIAEPLGRYALVLVTDEAGVGWWGYGYPELPPLEPDRPTRGARTWRRRS
jgi:hypothetical protein